LFDDLGNGQATNYLLAIGIVAVALAAMFVVFWLIRKRSNSTFIRGGKNRQPRLAVLDAAAVDTRRRLVLVRRDGVEHLILIGGPTDVVIESSIVPSNLEAAMPLATSEADSETLREQPTPQPSAPTSDPKSSNTQSHPVKHAPPNASSRTPGSIATTAAVAPAAPVNEATENALDVLDAARTRVLASPNKQTEQPVRSTRDFPARQPAAEQPAVEKPAATIADAYFEDDTAPGAPSQPENPPAPAQISNFSRSEPQTSATRSATVSTRQMPVPPSGNQQQPAVTDFEAILEAELAQDFDIGDDLGLDLSASHPGAQSDMHGDLSGVTPADQTRGSARNPARPDHPQTDTLEDEMDKLLGDLSRRNGSS